MANLSLKEITDVLNKSGAQGGSAFDMGQNQMGVEQGVRSQVYGQGQPVLDNAKKNYLAQLGKIAEMDGKLAGVYGDPTSPLYIERASRRDSAVHMAEAPNYSAAETHANIYESKKKELEESIKSTMQVYDEMTRLTKAQEAETAKQEREQAKTIREGQRIKQGTGKYVTGPDGKKVFVSQTKPADKNIKLTKDQVLAGFKDVTVANFWSKTEKGFRDQWSKKVLSGKATPPKNGYSMEDTRKRYDAWLKANPPKKKKGEKTSLF